MTVKLTLIVDSPAQKDVPFATGPERYQKLTDELGIYTNHPVRVSRGPLRLAPADGYVLYAGGNPENALAACEPTGRASLAERLVLLDVSWQWALDLAERHRLAGVVDSLRLTKWLARPSSTAGPFGIRYLARLIGASCSPLPPLRSTHYCLLESTRHRGLPHLLAVYLDAYDKDRAPLADLRSLAVSRLLKQAREAGAQQGDWGEPARIESVSTRRVIASLKRVRETARLSLEQVAEQAGLSRELVGRLEAGDDRSATLGTLRAYGLALEQKWGWAIEGLSEATLRIPESSVQAHAPTEEWRAPGPYWVTVEAGMTVMADRRTRRQPRWSDDPAFDPGSAVGGG